MMIGSNDVSKQLEYAPLDNLIERNDWESIPGRLAFYPEEASDQDVFCRSPLHRVLQQNGHAAFTDPHSAHLYLKSVESLLDINPHTLYEHDEEGKTPLHLFLSSAPVLSSRSANANVIANARGSGTESRETDFKSKEYGDYISLQILDRILSKASQIGPPKPVRLSSFLTPSYEEKIEEEEELDGGVYLLRMKSWRLQNTPLHELVLHASSWNRYHCDENFKCILKSEEEIQRKNILIQLIRKIVRIDRTTVLVRNRLGLTPLKMYFGNWLKLRGDQHEQHLYDSIIHYYNNENQSYNSNQNTPQKMKLIESNPQLFSRWFGVLSIIQEVSSINSAFDSSDTTKYNIDCNPFLYVHAIISIDRTYPVFPLILKTHEYQIRVKRKILPSNQHNNCHLEIESRVRSNHDDVGDLPLAVAAKCPMADKVISRLLKSFPQAAKQLTGSSKNSFTKDKNNIIMENIWYDDRNSKKQQTVLVAAIKSGKKWTNTNSGEETTEASALQILFQAFPEALYIKDEETHLYPFMVAAIGETSDVNTVFCLLRESPDLLIETLRNRDEKQGFHLKT